MSTIWIDLTTTRALRGRAPVGITRIERALALAAANNLGERVRFAHFDRYERLWLQLDPARAQRLLTDRQAPRRTGHGAPARRHGFAASAREIERRMRPILRRVTGPAMRALGSGDLPAAFAPGDRLVLLGDLATMRGIEPLLAHARNRRVGLIAMVYDLIPWRLPHFFADRASVLGFCDNLSRLLPHAEAILVPSRATGSDLEAFAHDRGLPLPPVAPIALGRGPVPEGQPRRPDWAMSLGSDGFALCVGTVQVRKNHRLLYNVWRRLLERGTPGMPTLVLAGDVGWLTGDVRALIARDPLVAGKIVITGPVDDDELAWLYRSCRFTLYPSLYEGWGLPVAESLCAGKTCITSSSSSMPEAAAGMTTLVDPYDFARWCDAVRAHVCDVEHLREAERRIDAGQIRAMWQDAERRFLDLLAKPAA